MEKNSFTVPSSPTPQNFTPVHTRKKSPWVKRILIIILIIGLPIGVFFSLPYLLSHFLGKDSPPPMVDDLRLETVKLEDSENAFTDLSQLSQIPVSKEDNNFILDYINNPPNWDKSKVQEVLARNSEVLASYELAAQKSGFQLPSYADPALISINTPLIAESPWRAVARLSNIKALEFSYEGNQNAGINESILSVALGYHMEQSQANLITHLVAIAIEDSGLQTILRIIPYSNLAPEGLKNFQQSLAAYTSSAEGLKKAYKVDYWQLASAIDGIRGGEIPRALIGSEIPDWNLTNFINNNFYFKPNKTKELYAQFLRKEIEKENSCGQQTLVIPQYSTNVFINYFTENAVGKLFMHQIVVPESSADLAKLECNQELLLHVVQTFFGLKMYVQDHHQLPNKLADLVPQYLEAIPKDPFNKSDLEYDPIKKIIYSVGVDGKDLGGSKGTDWAQMTNPTFEIKF